ncbi:MAG: formimidoylglutamate deiminase, partial [Acidimicrobiales bacterium]|nr:formimidoylglutamate deiminase [Acidimicrobiales bacterium]
EDAGIRITLLDTLYLHGGLGADGYGPPLGVQQRFADHSAAAWVERVGSLQPTSTQRIGAAIHSVRAVDPASMSALAGWAAERGAPLHAHVSEQIAENESCQAFHGRSPVALFADAGPLTANFSAVHATHLDNADIAALAANGSVVVMCPTTERDLGDGIGPTGQLAATGVPIALGSDSHAVVDLFEEARAVELHERLRRRERGIHQAADLLAMGTVVGHRCLGWADAGLIAVGQRADLVTIALDSVRTAGTNNHSATEAIVFAATASDVTDVFVDGRHVVSNRRHVRIDVASELNETIKELMDHD